MAINQMQLGPGVLEIGDTGTITSFSSQVTACRLVPNVDKEDPVWVLSGESVPGDRTESWQLTGTLLQDFGTSAESVSEWTFTNRGKVFPFTFTPNNTLSKSITGELQVEATEIGGDVKIKNTSDFEFDLIGEPELVEITPEGFAARSRVTDSEPVEA